MAKTTERQGTEYVALPKGSIDALNNEEPVTDEELAFDEFIAGMSAERMGELRVGKIKVARDGTPVANTRSAHCFSCPIDQFTYSGLVDHIRSKYGAGLYRVVGVETGKRGLIFNRLLEIAEELNPEKPDQNSTLQNPANVLESVGRIMAESQARTEGLIQRLTEARPATVDPMDQITKLAGVLATVMGVMPKPTQAAAPDLLGQLETLLKLKELFGASGGGGDSDKESNFFDVVKAGLQSFGPALATLAVRGAQAPAPALPPPQPPIGTDPRQFVPQPQPVTPAPPAQGDPAMKRQIDALVMNAKNGADINELAQTILNLTPDDKLDDLGDMLEAPDMVDKMALVNPEVQNYRDYFEKLRAALLALLDDAPADTLPPNQQPAAGGTGAPTA